MQKDNKQSALVDAKSTKNQPTTQLGDLRELLTTIETRVAKLGEISSAEALEILTLLDQVEAQLDALQTAGGITGSEAAQFESLLMQLEKKDAIFMNRVGGPSALQQARQERKPENHQWWWFIDESLAQKRRSKIQRWAIGAGVVGVLLIVLVVVYNQFLAPDPVFQEGIGYQQSAENLFIQGRYEDALLDTNQAIERLADFPELFVLQGVIHELLEQPDLAEESFKRARDAWSAEETFYNQRAKYYLLANLIEQSIADAEMAISINQDSAVSFLFLGQAHEVLGDFSSAADYYEAASEAAERADDIQIQVIARMNLAQALQRIGTGATPTPSE